MSSKHDNKLSDLRATFMLSTDVACEGFDKIAAVAALALHAVRDEKEPLNREVLTHALLVIRDTAHETGDRANYIAETAECNVKPGRQAQEERP